MRYTDSMNNGNEIPDRPYNRYEVPVQLIDDIDVIGAKFSSKFADLDMIDGDDIEDMEAEEERRNQKRAKIVELLKRLIEPATDNSYADKKKNEMATKLLTQMGCPVDNYDNILGMNFNPEMIADQMMEEAEEDEG